LADDPTRRRRLGPPAAAPPGELGTRAAGLVRAAAAWAFDHEIKLRIMIRLSLAPMSNPGEA
jgi:hypothetical protein